MTIKRNFVLGLISSSLFVGCGGNNSQSSEVRSVQTESSPQSDTEKKSDGKTESKTVSGDKGSDDCNDISADEFLNELSANKNDKTVGTAANEPDSCAFCKLSDEVEVEADSCAFCKVAEKYEGDQPDSCAFCKMDDASEDQVSGEEETVTSKKCK